VFENRVLRRVFVPKRDEVTGNGENYIRRSLGIFTSYPIFCGGVHRILVGKPEGKRPLGRPRRRWEDNIKMDLQEVGGAGDWLELAQDRDRWQALVNVVMNLQVR
jgi:hypothetical protein